MCNYCGKSEHYAKGFCRNCYIRFLRKGYPDYTYRLSTGSKKIYSHMNTIINDWEIISISQPNTNKSYYCITKVCIHCKTKYHFANHGTAMFKCNSLKKICGCKYKYKPRTEKQLSVYQSFVANKYNYTNTAKDIGLTKQRIKQIIDSIKE